MSSIIEQIAAKIKVHAFETTSKFDSEVAEKTSLYAATYTQLRESHAAAVAALDANFTSLADESFAKDQTDLSAVISEQIVLLKEASDGVPVTSLKEANDAIAEYNAKYNSDLAASISTADAEYDAYVAKVGEMADFTVGFTTGA
jgi:hypothetical protein